MVDAHAVQRFADVELPPDLRQQLGLRLHSTWT